MRDLIRSLMENVPDDEARYCVYADMIQTFSNEDCDTLEECLEVDPQFDRAYREYE